MYLSRECLTVDVWMHARPVGLGSAKLNVWTLKRLMFYARPGPEILSPNVDVEPVDVWMHAKPGPEMLDPSVDAEMVDVWIHARPVPSVDAVRCVFPPLDAS